MTEEPTILDYVKALFTPWRGAPPKIPPLEIQESGEQVKPVQIQESIGQELPSEEIVQPVDSELQPERGAIHPPWRSLVALGLAIIAQISLQPRDNRQWMLGLVIYLLAAAWAIWAWLRGEWILPYHPTAQKQEEPYSVRTPFFWVGIVLAVLAFLAFGGNQFTLLNVLLWLASLVCILYALWLPTKIHGSSQTNWLDRIRDWGRSLHISRWIFVLVGVAALVIFFSFHQLRSVPPEMISDHAEKMLDIWDVLHGETHIFFPRNTGREGMQMYLTAGIIQLVGTGYSFLSMKIGTALVGLFMLPFIYLLGKEIANRRVGLWAVVLAGTAYWTIVITRVSLRFIFYPAFVAPLMYFLIRGLRRSSRNDFILAGLFLGLGLHGYSPFRIVPFLVILAVGLYLLHPVSQGVRRRTVLYFGLLVLISLIVFLPLLRFWIDNPEMFGFRAFTRLASVERPLPGPAGLIFLQNLRNALTMFGWSNGEIWPVSIPLHPALDVLSAALFYLGITLLAVRYFKRWNWIDLFLILSVPILMLPSILSLAFPSENPALNRTAGALVPVFLIIGLAFEGFLVGLKKGFPRPAGKVLMWTVAVLLLAWVVLQNYDLIFNQYQRGYALSSWNTSELGQVIHDLTNTVVEEKNTYVVAYPYWVDTRLVGLNAGYPTRDFAIWPEEFSTTLENPGAKAFLIKQDDQSSLETLQSLYPQGYTMRYPSRYESNKDFYIFLVLPNENAN